MYQIYRITVAQGIAYDCMADAELNLRVGDRVIVKCDRYQESAVVSQCKQVEPFESLEEYEARHGAQNKGRHIEGQKLPQILRVATYEDLNQIRDNESRTDDVFIKTVECIHHHGLEMKLIMAHYSFDRKVLLFQFSADGRVDFRELLRDLSSLFRVRVELRQVGVRDEAAICGGVGTCGRPFCCATFLHSINSVNVKMAKQQGVSLNPQSISGCCGRLKCCLQYESEDYAKEAKENKEAKKNAPVKQGEKKNNAHGVQDKQWQKQNNQKQNRPMHNEFNKNKSMGDSGKANSNGEGGVEFRG